MAVTTNRLQMVFKNQLDANKTISLSSAKPNAAAADVKALMDGIITNGAIFSDVPVIKRSAALISTTTTEIDVED